LKELERGYRTQTKELKQKSKSRPRNQSIENRPEFDNVCFDSKVERKKDRKGGRGEFITDKITNPNAEAFSK